MRCEEIHLNERFPILGEAGKDPLLAVYLPTPMLDDNLRNEKRPCVLICPGGHHGVHCGQSDQCKAGCRAASGT